MVRDPLSVFRPGSDIFLPLPFLCGVGPPREMGGSGGDRPCWDQAWDSERRDVTEAIVICLEEKEDHLMLYNEVGTAPFPSIAHRIKNLPQQQEGE